MTAGAARAGQDGVGLFAPAILAAAGLALVAAGVVWLAGHLALLATGDGWPDAPFTRSGGLLAGLLRGQPADTAWATAYPDAAGGGTPSVVGFWAAVAVQLLGLLAVAGCGLRLWQRHADRLGADPNHGWPGLGLLGRWAPGPGWGSRWASRGDERTLTCPVDPAGRRWRLVAGRSQATRRVRRRRRGLLAGQDCVSAVVFGPNGSGKTTSLVVPNVLDWDGPVVLTTSKPHDLEPICSARAARGPVWVIAPGGAPGHHCVGWSPVAAAVDDEAADRVAEWLVDASGMTLDPKARPWNAQARKYLKGLLLAAHVSGAGVGQWTEWIHAGEKAADTITDILRTAGHADTARQYASTWQIHDEGKGSVLFTALGLADTYTRPGIALAADTGGFTVPDLLRPHPTQASPPLLDPTGAAGRPQAPGQQATTSRARRSGRAGQATEQLGWGTLCLVTPTGEGDRFAGYFTALIAAVIHAAETTAAHTGGPLNPRLLLALDEAGNVFRYPRLPDLVTTARGHGIQLLLIYHDMAQLEHLYHGRDVARTVLSNAKMRMLLPGVADLDTLRYWTDLIGRTRTHTHGQTRSADGHKSRSRTEHTDDLAPLHTLQQLPDGHGLLLYQNLPPTRVRLLPWYTNPRYRHLRAHAPGPDHENGADGAGGSGPRGPRRRRWSR
jgi:hypothetical protein